MRTLGTYELPFNYEGKIEGIIDARMLVPTYADLLLFTEENYLPNGFIVSVLDIDTQKRGLYQLIDNTDLSNPDSWVKVSSGISVTSKIEIPEGSDYPLAIDYTPYITHGNDPTLSVELRLSEVRTRIVTDITIEKEFDNDGNLITLYVWGYDSGDGETTIDDLILLIK